MIKELIAEWTASGLLSQLGISVFFIGLLVWWIWYREREHKEERNEWREQMIKEHAERVAKFESLVQQGNASQLEVAKAVESVEKSVDNMSKLFEILYSTKG